VIKGALHCTAARKSNRNHQLRTCPEIQRRPHEPPG
jgi:hypothetical protein